MLPAAAPGQAPGWPRKLAQECLAPAHPALRELTALNLAEGEISELEREQHRLANANQLLETGQRLLNWLIEGEDD